MKKILILFILSAVVPIFAGSKQWNTGNGNFAAYFLIDYDIKVAKENKKSSANLSPETGARLFGRNIPVLGADLIVGNYGSFSYDNFSVAYDVNKASDWSVYVGVDICGVTIWSKTRNIGKVEGDLGSTNKWFKKDLPAIRYPVGPLTIAVNYGVTQNFTAKPSVKPDLNTKSLAAEFKPTLSASAFIEGFLDAYVLRGGVGANLNLFTGSAGPKLTISLITNKIELLGSLFTQLLNGRVYGFVDNASIKCCFRKVWNRIVDITIFSWNGLKYSNDFSIWSYSF